ncbi:hypothetical protein [Streptomyces formicae]|uniref:Uncharacterized protein n=1 Tax=Streptomyces formicae TaxID=1616117 RepID=A0A291QI38_9ACTN|nr:hypothetical protein [Streptomyces formicae]ATL31381.1 hypothetical protein KY5_6363c [Streptomyces formicae]
MPGTGTSRAARKRTWLVVAALVALVAASSVTWFAVAADRERDEIRAANQDQFTRACAGLLPDELRSFMPDDERGDLDEYGTMPRAEGAGGPRQESRALLDCTLTWGSRGEGWEPDARTRVRAEAVLGRTAPLPADGGFELPLPESALGSVSVDDRLDGSTVTAAVLADCPKGLTGRVRPSRDLLVTVDLPSREDEYDVPESERLLASRTAARVANWVAEKQRCGGKPLSTEPGRERTGASKVCDWFSPKALRLAPGRWSFGANAATYSRRTGACGGQWDDTMGSPGHLAIKAADAESWSGVLANGAYDSHQDSGDVPGPGKGTARDKPVTIGESGDDPELALWARSRCDAGATYHRVSVTPEIDFDRGIDEGRAVLEPKDRRRLSDRARAVLDRYLAAPAGWPRRSHCRDTKVMGEVASWRD